MNKITNEQLDALIKSAVNSSGPLPPDEKFSQIISALRELRDLRASMLQGAENAESRCTTQTAPALVSLPKNAESRCGNSPVVPDGWTGSDEANAALIMLDRIETVDSVDDDRIEGIKRIIRGLAAAPQQEARKSNVIGSYQGADGQEHPIVSLSSPQEVK
ncbi:hypothetical protein ACEWB5_16210 [Citrobacter koseri]|uniref:hypothetical protein n=1 Tax=Citrobacter koseri TaxID=545 RepID=UPI003989D78D